jgi:adenosylcobyric acid synthase
MGRAELTGPGPGAFEIDTRNGQPSPASDGAIGARGAVVGSMLHGLLENDALRERLLAHLRRRRGLSAPQHPRGIPRREAEYDRLEAAVREHLDRRLLLRLAGLQERS